MLVTAKPRQAESLLGRPSSPPPQTSMRTPLLPAWRGTPGASDFAVGFLRTKSPTPSSGDRCPRRQGGPPLALRHPPRPQATRTTRAPMGPARYLPVLSPASTIPARRPLPERCDLLQFAPCPG